MTEKKRMNPVWSFLCAHARSEMAYALLFVSVICYFSCLPYSGNVLYDCALGIVLLSGFVTYLFRRDIPGVALIVPYAVYMLHQLLTCSAMFGGAGLFFRLVMGAKILVLSLILLESLKILTGHNPVEGWRKLFRAGTLSLGIVMIAEVYMKCTLYIHARPLVTGPVAIFNQTFMEIFFILFCWVMIVPPVLKLNNTVFIHFAKLAIAGVIVSLSYLFVVCLILRELPPHGYFCMIFFSLTVGVAAITHLLAKPVRRPYRGTASEKEKLFYSEELMKLWERSQKVLEMLECSEKNLKELKKSESKENGEKIKIFLEDLEDEKEFLLYYNPDEEELDEIEEKIRRIDICVRWIFGET